MVCGVLEVTLFKLREPILLRRPLFECRVWTFYPHNAKECVMLIITRRIDETVLVGDNIEVTVLAVKGNQVRIGFNAPEDILILREELADTNFPINSIALSESTDHNGRQL